MYDYLLNEAKLKSSERTDFGLPSKKKYPMPDADHVRAAIRMFNHCDPEDEAELARNIKKYMKKYGVNDIEVGENNRFSKYYKKSVQEGIQERYLNKDDLLYFAALDMYEKEFKKVFGENESLGKRRKENWYEIGYLRIKNSRMATKLFDAYKARFEAIYGDLVEKGFDVVFEDDDNGYIIRYNTNNFGDNVINNMNNILSESAISTIDTYEGMKTNQNEKEWRLKIKNIPLDIDALQKLGYPLEYAKRPQPCIMMNGKKYRARAELLLFNEDGDKVLIQQGKNRGGFNYTLCGGGIDNPKVPITETAIRECEEEALVVPKNVQFTGIVWFMEYHKEVKSCDGAIVFVCTGEYDRQYKGYIKKIDRDSFATKAKWVDLKKANLGEPHRLAAKVYLGQMNESANIVQEVIGEESNDIYFEEEPETNIASITEEVESMIQELSGGGGPMIGMEINDQSVTTYNPGMFIISYGSKKDADPNNDIATSSGYAVANDLRSKYILVKKKNKVVREDYVEFLTDRKISIYEYTGDVSKWYEMLKSIDEGKSNGEFYTALTGRELLTDDQIYFDEHFKYYNPFKTKIENGMTLDLNKEYSLVEGREFLLPVMDDEMLKLQERVNNINPNYTIKEGPKGYFIVSEAEGKCSALPLSKHDIEE